MKPQPVLARSDTMYRTVWRRHFYVGLFCIPFILRLAVTGSIYLFEPQLDAFIDRPYDGLAFAEPPASAREQTTFCGANPRRPRNERLSRIRSSQVARGPQSLT
jgi:uncharacterized iron-regulated membrane protein